MLYLQRLQDVFLLLKNSPFKQGCFIFCSWGDAYRIHHVVAG